MIPTTIIINSHDSITKVYKIYYINLQQNFYKIFKALLMLVLTIFNFI